MISDNELMLIVKHGDIKKIGMLYERYSKILFAYFFKLTAQQAKSEDLVNDTFIKMVKYKDKYRGDGTFRIWMYKIARSVFVDNYNKNRSLVFINDYQEHTLNEDHFNNVSSHKEIIENKQAIHKALLKLKKNEREILILSNFDGLKYKEIGKILNCTEGAVKVRIFRAIQKLRTEYLKIKADNYEKE